MNIEERKRERVQQHAEDAERFEREGHLDLAMSNWRRAYEFSPPSERGKYWERLRACKDKFRSYVN